VTIRLYSWWIKWIKLTPSGIQLTPDLTPVLFATSDAHLLIQIAMSSNIHCAVKKYHTCVIFCFKVCVCRVDINWIVNCSRCFYVWDWDVFMQAVVCSQPVARLHHPLSVDALCLAQHSLFLFWSDGTTKNHQQQCVSYLWIFPLLPTLLLCELPFDAPMTSTAMSEQNNGL